MRVPVPPGVALTARDAVFGPAVTGENVIVIVQALVGARICPVQPSTIANSDAFAPPTVTPRAPVDAMPVFRTVKVVGALRVPRANPENATAVGATVTAPGATTFAASASVAESAGDPRTVTLPMRLATAVR